VCRLVSRPSADRRPAVVRSSLVHCSRYTQLAGSRYPRNAVARTS